MLRNLLFLFFLAPCVLFAASPRFEHLTVEDGLAHASIWDILQDRDGFLWFATAGGLNRYDGYRFKLYLNDPADPDSLSENLLYCLLQDQRGLIWIGTRGRGVDRLDPATERFTHFETIEDDPHSLLGSSVWGLAEDSHGRVWIGTDLALNRFDPQTKRFTRFVHDPEDPGGLGPGSIESLVFDQQGDLWIGLYGGGVARLNTEDETFTHFLRDPEGPASVLGNEINKIIVDRKSRLWVSSNSGLSLLDPLTGVFRDFPHDPEDPRTISADWIFALTEDRRGRIWAGSDHGLNLLEESGDDEFSVVRIRHDASDAESLGGDEVLTIFEDREGILWVGTRANLSRYDPHRERFRIATARDGLEGASIMALDRDAQGIVWAAAAEDGLLIRKPGQKAVRSPLDFGETPYQASFVLIDRAGEIWVAVTNQGLYRLRPDGSLMQIYRHDPEDANSLIQDSIYALAESPEGEMWIASYDFGIQRLDREHQHFSSPYRHDPDDPRSLTADDTYHLSFDRAGGLWVGTFGGLNHLPPSEIESGRFTRYRHDRDDPYSLSGDNVTTVLEDFSGGLWVGTSSGLNRLDRETGRFQTYRRRHGLPHDKIVGIQQTRPGELWIATSAGLSRFNLETRKFRNYTRSDGLHGDVFYIGSQASDRGEIFFGGVSGWTSFRPEDILDDPLPPKAVVTELLLYNQPAALQRIDPDSPLKRAIRHTESLELQPHHKVFGFELAALHFGDPAKNRLAYRLEGFEDRWTETGADRRFAYYTNLDPGRYVFRVRASQRDGVWSEDVALKIRVLPPLWRTWQAYVIYVLALLGAVALYIGSHRRELQRERDLAQREREINRQLREIDRRKDELMAEKTSRIKVLEGILPICANCKKIRDEDGRWNQLETYIDSHSEAEFSHGFCPDCVTDYQQRSSGKRL